MPITVCCGPSLVQVAWLPAPEMNEYNVGQRGGSVESPGTGVQSAWLTNFVKVAVQAWDLVKEEWPWHHSLHRIDSRIRVGAAAALGRR